MKKEGGIVDGMKDIKAVGLGGDRRGLVEKELQERKEGAGDRDAKRREVSS